MAYDYLKDAVTAGQQGPRLLVQLAIAQELRTQNLIAWAHHSDSPILRLQIQERLGL